MDHESLRTASTYLNNLLLARGLLRNSEPIDFVKPSKESRAQIINLVHDLILREDRDRDQREHVAVTLRILRAEDSRKGHEIGRLTARNEESARALVQVQASERAAREEVKKVERAMKSLQDQSAKLRTALAQVKAQCTNDVRKRDLELARLKSHLQGQQRGNKVSVVAPSMTITGGTRKPVVDASVHELGDLEYSLKQETTEFLTQLSQSLSDENDSLITLIRGALGTVRELLGLPANHPDSAIGSMGSNEDGSKQQHQDPNILHTLPTSYETLTADMEATLTHLKSVLTNPNFVSMEEVEVREEEIARLREGWERMEQRWRDVLLMMEGWRRKMDTGDTINIDDLRRGIGMVSPEHHHGSNGIRDAAGEPDQSFIGSDVSEIRIPGIYPDESSSLVLEPPPQFSSPVKGSPKRKRDVLEPPEFFDLRPASRKSVPASPGPAAADPNDAELGEQDADEEGEDNNLPRMTVAEKLDLARTEAERAAKAPIQASSSKDPPRTASTQGGATAVATTNGFASKPGAPPAFMGGLNGAADYEDEGEQDDTLGKMMPSPSNVKKIKIRGRPKKRRKSTLSPEELEELMMGAEEG